MPAGPEKMLPEESRHTTEAPETEHVGLALTTTSLVQVLSAQPGMPPTVSDNV